MKHIFIAKTRWEYHASHVAGLLIVLVSIGICIYFSIEGGKLEFNSWAFWIGLLLVLLYPFGIISVFSSINHVTVFDKALAISYRFRKHTTQIIFSDVESFETFRSSKGTTRSSRDHFRIKTAGGRAFEFMRSQFDNYDKLENYLRTAIKKK